MSDDKPNVPYWHLYTDDEGISRQKRCALTRFELKVCSRLPRRNGRARSTMTG